MSHQPRYFVVFKLLATLALLSSACKAAQIIRDTGDGQVCGTVSTSFGETVTLREGVSLSKDDFAKLNVMKLKGAVFSPLTEQQCVMRVCGFTSFTSRPPQFENTSLIGSFSDYADCEIITKNETKASPMIYNDLFNASSISCGCSKGIGDCVLNCFERDINWKENECAILYQESFCKTCHFNPITIQQDIDLFITDNTHHIRSARVREHCTLIQDITGLNRIWRFRNEQSEIHYGSTPTASNVKSAFLHNPETFSCTCNAPPPVEPGSFDLRTWIYILIGFSTLLGIGLLSALIYNCKLRRSLNDDLDLVFENVTTRGCPSELDYSQLEGSPFGPRFLISESHLSPTSDQLIGRGNFGAVRKELLQIDVATKLINHESSQRQMCIESLRQEIKIMAHLGVHKNVVRFIGYSIEGELKLVMEFCQNESLRNYLLKIRSQVIKKWEQTLPERERSAQILEDVSRVGETSYRDAEHLLAEQNIPEGMELDTETKRQFLQWCEEIAEGMDYLTSKKIVHVDLATRNVLLDEKLTAKIADFGLAMKTYLKDYRESREDTLPIQWLAPEVLQNKRCSSKSDVWSYGITIWEVFTVGDKPFIAFNPALQLSAIQNGKRLGRPVLASEDV